MMAFTCNKCNREFASEQSLNDHNRSKHYDSGMDRKKEKFSFNNKYVWIFVGIVVVFLFLWSTPVIDFKAGKYDEFAQCITDSGAKMFGAYWCPHCTDQKKAFGSSWKLISYIECSLPNNAGQTQVCIDESIEGYPTWEFGDETRRSGFIPLESLSETTGCQLP